MSVPQSVRPKAAMRPVIDLPGLEVVPTPAPARGFIGVVLTCLALFIAAFGVAFHLNTQMVEGAYELKNIRVELSEVTAREATLEKEAMEVSTPEQLRQAATDLGMTPAAAAYHVDVETGVITAPPAKD